MNNTLPAISLCNQLSPRPKNSGMRLFLLLTLLIPFCVSAQPVISSISPQSGYTGASVTIAGTGFNATAANNIVYFGATRATVSSSSATSLTVNVPAGATYMPVSVNNTATHLAGYSQYSFLPTFNNSGYAPASVHFDSSSLITLASPYNYVEGMVVSDIDGDGKPDLVLIAGSNVFLVYRNISTTGTLNASSFDTPVAFTTSTGSQPSCIAVGDIDGDGKPDVVVGNADANTISVFRNTASSGSITSSSFATRVDFSTHNYALSIAIADIDGDGKNDIAALAHLSFNDSVMVFRNTATSGSIASSSLAAPVGYPLGYDYRSIQLVDINGDNKPELLAANTNSISIFKNTATTGAINSGSFTPDVNLNVSFNYYGHAPFCVRDVNGDGKPDIIGSSYNSVVVVQNISAGGAIYFTGAISFNTGVNTNNAIDVGDLDGDGKPDIIVNHSDVNTVSVLRNATTGGFMHAGSFSAPTDFYTNEIITPYANIAIADMDGDGKPDIIAPAVYYIALLKNDPMIQPISGLGSVVVCQAITLSDALSGGTWSSSDAGIATVSSSGVVTGVSTGTVNITYSVSIAGVTKTAVKLVAVQPSCGGITGSGYVYTGLNVMMTDPVSGGTWTTSDNSIATVSSTGLVTGVAAGNVDISYTVTTSCGSASAVHNLTVYATPLAPVITALSSSAGAPGTAITITGFNFNTTPDSNIVYFGSTRAGVASATATSLSVTIPSEATYLPVSVNNMASGLTGYSHYSFLPSFDHSSIYSDVINFNPSFDIPAGNGPRNILLHDMDGDGKSDLVVLNQYDNTVSIYRNIGPAGMLSGSSFDTRVDYATGSYPSALAIGDIDGDGRPDIAITNGGDNTISILQNTASPGTISSGSFAAKVDISASNPTAIAIVDIDGDGMADLVTGNASSMPGVSVFRNIGTGGAITTSTFATQVDFTVTSVPGPYFASSIATGDIDGDGRPDIVISNSSNNSIEILRNTAVPGSVTSSSLADNIDILVGTGSANWVTMGDIDGDGKPDLVVANAGITLLRNTAVSGAIDAGSFASHTDIATGNQMMVTMGDINGDNKPDLVLTDFYTPQVSVMRNTSVSGSLDMSSFAPKVYLTTTYGPYNIAVGDLDGDSKPDIALANWGASSITLIKNNPATIVPSGPTVTSMTPAVANPGTSVTIAGTQFNTSVDSNVVYFGATKATVTSATSTSLSATVPIGATLSPVSVTNKAVSLTGRSSFSFLPKFDNTGYVPNAVNFDAFVSFPGGYAPQVILFKDMDGDGKPDMIVGADSLYIYRNISTSGSINSSSFADKVGLPIGGGSYLTSILTEDIDGDGKPDMVLSTDSIYIYHNVATSGSISAGSFSAMMSVGNYYYPQKIATGDIDGDGKPDIVFYNSSSWPNSIFILRNTATPGIIDASSFSASPASIGTGYGGYSVSSVLLKDLDNDGKLDIVLSHDMAALSMWRNKAEPGYIGNSSFENQLDIYLGSAANLVIEDIDGDHMPEIITASYVGSGAAVSVYKNIGIAGYLDGGSFAGSVDYSIGSSSGGGGGMPFLSFAVADVNGDGKSDIIANMYDGTNSKLVVLQNQVSGGFLAYNSFLKSGGFTAGNYGFQNFVTAVCDIDGDSRPDLAIGSSYGTINVLRNDPLLPPPTVTAVSPAIDSPGTSVTVTGTHFNTTAANNNVWFGATRATVNTATATSLNVTVPFGASYKPVSVNNTALSLTGIARYPFLPDFHNDGIDMPGAINFDARVDYTMPGGYLNSKSIIADIDGDGKPDIIIGGDSLYVFRNISATGTISPSSFAPPVGFPGYVSSIVVEDIDGDGKKDVVVTGGGYMSLFVFRNLSVPGTVDAGTFSAPVEVHVNTGPYMDGLQKIVAADMDGDGKMDIVSSTSTYILIIRNTASVGTITPGSFAPSVIYPNRASSPGYTSLCTGDLDGDGKPEILVAGNYDSVFVMHNISTTGNFNDASLESAIGFKILGSNISALALGDIDGDGKLDIVANASDYTESFSILRNTSTPGNITSGSFATHIDYHKKHYFSSTPDLCLGDVDGDGKPDVVLPNSYSDTYGNDTTISVFRNISTSGSITASSFEARLDFVTGLGPQSVNVSDLDGDGKPEIVTSSNSYISVLKNDPLLLRLCVGTSHMLRNSVTGGTWSSSNTAVASIVSSTGVVTGIQAGTSVITYNFSGGGINLRTVTVNALPVPGTISGPSAIPVGLSTLLSDTVANGTWSSNDTSKLIAAFNGTAVGVSPGTAIVTYTVANDHCPAFATKTITVIPSSVTPVITTFAGSGLNNWYGTTGDGGPAINADIYNPIDIAADKFGNVFVLGSWPGNKVRKINAAGIISTFAGTGYNPSGPSGSTGDGGLATAATFSNPYGVAVDKTGNVYISEQSYSSTSNIRKVNTSGIINNFAGTGGFGNTGNGGAATAAHIAAYKMATDSTGNLYFSDWAGYGVVRKINTSGIISQLASGVGYYSGIAADRAGNIYLAGDNVVRKITPAGVVSIIAGTGDYGDSGDGGLAVNAKLNGPSGIAVDRQGVIYITERNPYAYYGDFFDDSRIRKITPDGIISSFAGYGATGFSGDGGPAGLAKLNGPTAIAVDTAGRVYIADAGNSRIRVINPKPTHAPVLTGGSMHTFAVCENADSFAISSLLSISDVDTGEFETWSADMAPAHGTIPTTFTGVSYGGSVTPSGLVYVPNPGYSGIDSFRIVVSDGSSSVKATFIVTVNAGPATIVGDRTVAVGSSVALTETVTGGTWTSSNSAKVSVNASTGVVTGVSTGTAKISYTLSNGCSTSITERADTAGLPVCSTWNIVGAPDFSVGDAGWTSMIIDTSGRPIVAYQDGGLSNYLRVVRYNGSGGWDGMMDGITSGPTNGTAFAHAPDGTMYLAIAFQAAVKKFNGTTWQNVGAPGFGLGISGTVTNDIAINNAGIPYVVIQDLGYSQKATVVRYNGSGWEVVGSRGFTPGFIDFNKIAFDASGAPVVTCRGSSNSITMRFNGSSWSTIGTFGYYSAMARDAAGNIYVVFNDDSSSGQLTVKKYTGSGWITVGNAGFSTYFSSNLPSIGIDNGGRIYVNYTNGSGKVIVMKYDGISWVKMGDVGVSAVYAATPPMAIGADGTPYLVIRDIDHSGSATVMKANISPFVPEITGTTSFCQGATVTLTDGVAGGTWASNDATIALLAGPDAGIVTGNNSGETMIMHLTNSSCLVQLADVLVTPSSMYTAPNLCIGSSTFVTYWPSGGVWSSGDSAVAKAVADPGAPAYGDQGIGKITGIASGTANISYTLSNGCSAILQTTVNTSSIGAIAGSTSICSGASATLSDTSVGGTWISYFGTVSIGYFDGSMTGYTPGVDQIVYTMPDGCTTSAFVTVNAAPYDFFMAPDNICVGVNIGLYNAPGGTWSTDAPAIGSLSFADADSMTVYGPHDGVVFLTGLAAGVAHITYTMPGGCKAFFTLTVNALPSAITGAATICTGASATLFNAIGGGTWTSSDPSVALVGSTGIVSAVSAGTVTISYSVSNTCGDSTVTKNVTVSPATTAGAITGSSTVCVGAANSLSDAVSGGSWASSNPSVATVNSSGVVTGVTAGSALISYTVSNSCGSATATKSVSVNSLPSAGAITGASSLCAVASVSLADAVSGGTWSSSNTAVGTVSSSGVVHGMSGGIVTISYTVSNSCGNSSATKLLTVNPLPNPGSITGLSSVNTGQTITLSDAVSGGVWTAGGTNATVSATGVVSGVAVGSVTISYTVTNSCGSSVATKLITVNTALPGITGTLSVCAGATTTLSNAAGGGTWASSNTAVATISSTGVVSGISSGNAVITYTAAGSYITASLTVNASPSVINGTLSMCAGNSTTLNNGTGGGTWSSSNTAVATIGAGNGIVSGLSSGTATISYALSSGCASSAIVSVNPLPGTITGANNVCAGATTTLGNTTGGGNWSSSSTSVATISSTGVVSGVAGGVTNITYSLGTGCATTAFFTVNTIPASITGTTVVCQGMTTNLSTTTTGGAWSSSDNSVATITTTGVVTGGNAGVVNISYTVGTGCARIAPLTVNALPSAITGSAGICIGTSSTLSSTPAGGVWTGGTSGNININPSGLVTGVAAGTATVSYTVGSGCKATIIVTVNSLPPAITGTAKACIGYSTTLANSVGGGVWSSSDVSMATVGSVSGIVTGVAAGTPNITYTTGAGCYVVKSYTVNPLPAPITGTTSTCIGSSTALTSATSPGLAWTSSNTAIATVNTSTGSVTGAGAGTATITYSLGSGCFTTTIVTVNDVPATIGGASSVCAATTTTLTNTISGGAWSSSNNLTATVGAASGVVTGVAAGNVYISYSTGPTCYKTKLITVNAPGAGITGYPVVCIGLSTTLSCAGGGTWSSSDASVATVPSGAGYVSGVAAGTATILFTPTATGCPSFAIVTVDPVPGAITGTTSVCVGSATTLANSSVGGSWISSNTAIGTVGSASGVVTGIGSGTLTITYAIGANCKVTTPFTVKVLPAAIGGTPSVCQSAVTTLSDVTSGGVWSSSNTSVATVGTGASASYGVVSGVAAGATTISYTVTATGCAKTLLVSVNPSPNAGVITGSTFSLNTISAPTSVSLSSTGDAGGAWVSSNTGVATIGAATGLVSATGAGSTTISYTVTLGSCTARATHLLSVTAARPGSSAGVIVGSMQLYPNPTTGGFTVEATDAGVLYIFTLEGKELINYEIVRGTSVHSLPADIAAGVYMCRFSGNDGSTSIVRLVYEP